MSKGMVKNIIIVLLLTLSVYQTARLWLGYIANRNFLYSLVENLFTPPVEEQSSLVLPYRLLTCFGGNTFEAVYQDIENAPQKASIDEAISAALKNGEYVGLKEYDYLELFDSQGYIYDYHFSMHSDIFVRVYGQKSTSLTSRVKSFDMVMTIPTGEWDDNLHVLFISKEDFTYHEFAIADQDERYNFTDSIRIARDKLPRQVYAAAMPEEADTFFIVPGSETYRCQAITVYNPYTDGGDKLLHVIDRMVDDFFVNPAAKWNSFGTADEGVFTYSEGDTVVKYYPNDVLEYSNYMTQDNKQIGDIVSNYSAAIMFIQKDKYVANDYYLSGYSEGDSSITFYFDYIMNNKPVLMPDDLKSELSMAHSIEITVQNERVQKYKKLCYNYQPYVMMAPIANMDFDEALTSLNPGGDEPVSLKAAELGYKIDKNGILRLYWFLSTENGTLLYEAKW